MEAYLDNGATTRPFKSVRDMMQKTMEVDYGNPSSKHRKGLEAERYIREAKEGIASSLKVDSKEIIFTSGGTESNNMALIGTAFGNKRSGNHIITTKIEHPSVYNSLIYLEEQGFCITYVNVDKNGRVKIKELLDSINENTIVVSVMYVNNEMGAVEEIELISKKIKEKKPDILFHVDGIQAYGKFRIYPKRMGIDLLSASGHKIHGPKGIGFLYIKDKVKVKPIIFGGEQQKGFRSGTENVPGIAGLGQAVKEIFVNQEEKMEKLYQMKQVFLDEVVLIDGVFVNGLSELNIRCTAPHIVSVSFAGIKSEVLLHALEEKEIYVSSGSACSSNRSGLSGTLKAIGIKENLLDSTLRFSFSVETTMEEILYTIENLKELVPVLRRYIRH